MTEDHVGFTATLDGVQPTTPSPSGTPVASAGSRDWVEVASRLSKNLAIIVAIISGLSAISGAAWSLFEFARATREGVRFAQVAQLTTYASFGELLKEYHHVEDITDNYLRQHRRSDWEFPTLLTKYGTGASMYYSPELKDFREIHQFYEELGALIHFNAVDFELVFQLITFPSDFQETTQPLQHFLRDHWFELRSDPTRRMLKDFGCNLEELSRAYQRRRTDPSFKWGPEVENVCS